MCVFGPVLPEPAAGPPPPDVLANEAGQAMIVCPAGSATAADFAAAPEPRRLVPRGGRLAVALADRRVLGWARLSAEAVLLLARSVHLGVLGGGRIREVATCDLDWDG